MEREEALKVAARQAPADLVVKNGKLVNVYSGEIHPADVAVTGDRIAIIGDVEAVIGPDTEVVDATGMYICPGLIDGHIHVGGSQFSMTEFARTVIAHGTTTISTDFYEIGVVAGLKAIRFALDEFKRTPLKVFVNIPPHHYLGLGKLGNPNNIRTEDVLEILSWPDTLGLAEWNVGLWNLPIDGVKQLTRDAWRRNKVLDGHYGQTPPEFVDATAVLGAYSEHEAMTAEEALDKLRRGINIQLREGSAGRDLANVVKAVTELGADPRHFTFITDEQEADSLALDGHVDHKVRTAIREGVAPLTAIQMATINIAEHWRMGDEIGSVGPGKIADMVLVDDLAQFNVRTVIADGKVVARDGRYTAPLEAPEYPDYYRNTIKIDRMTTPEDFAVPAPAGSKGTVGVRTIGYVEGSLVTEDRRLQLPVRDGVVQADPSQDVLKIAILDRYEASGRIGKAFLQGFRFKGGALGTSFNPGIMNLMVAGYNDADLSLVANRIAELGGGYVVAKDGKILGELPLPLLGLFSDEPADKVVERLQVINKAIREDLGTDVPGLHTAIAFMCLAVSIPTLKICDLGLADIRIMEPVDMFA